MSKTIKTFLSILFIFLLLLNINYVLATEENINENLEQETSIDDGTTENTENVIQESSSDTSSLSVLSPSTGTSVSSINSYEQANLHLNNVLSIILIAIGVLLILLAIAILIRIGNKNNN